MKSKVLRRAIALMLSLITAVSIMSVPLTVSARYTDADIENKIQYHELNCREDDCDCLEPESNKFAVVSPVGGNSSYDDYILVDTYQNVQKYFNEHGWTDGLPIVPPTWIKAEKFMRYTPYSDNDVVATVNGRNVTAYQVAVNAIMSGCSAEYLPVCIAFVEALGDEAYLNSLKSGNLTPMMYVNGPIARQLGIDNAQGMTTEECNIAIARFMELALINLAGLERTNSFGYVQPLVFSEDEQNCINVGWDPHHVEQGYDLNDNVITATSFAMWGNNVTPATDLPEEIMKVIAWDITEKNLGGLGGASIEDNADTQRTILITPSVAQALAKKYKSKEALENALVDNARRPLWMRTYAYYYANTGSALTKSFSEIYDLLKETESEDAKLTASPAWMNGITYANIDTVATMTKGNTNIVIQGDESRNKTQVMPGGISVSKEIKLDTNWDDLLASMVISIVYQPLSALEITPVDNSVKLPSGDTIPTVLQVTKQTTYRIAASASYANGTGKIYYDSATATLYYWDGSATQSVVLDTETYSDFIAFVTALGVNSSFTLNRSNNVTAVYIRFSSNKSLPDKNTVELTKDAFGTVTPTIAANVTSGSNGNASIDGSTITMNDTVTTFTADLGGDLIMGSSTDSGFVKVSGTTVTVDPTAPAGATAVVGVSDGSGAYRTMTFVNGGDGTYKITYNTANTLTLTASSYYLKGTFNNWEATDAFVKTDNDDILAVVKEVPAGTYTFKVHNAGADEWHGNSGTFTDTANRWTMDSSSDCTFKATGGTYEFKYEISTNKLSVYAAQDDVVVDPVPTTKTVYVGVVEHIKDFVPTLHYWNDSGLAGDASLTATGETEMYAVGSAYWSNQAQKFNIYKTTVPVEATKMKTFKASGNTNWAAEEITYSGEDMIILVFEYSGTYHNQKNTYTEPEPVVTYTVTFKNYDGTVLATRTVEEGKAATAPSNPTRPSTVSTVYTFSSWDKDFSNITSDLTVTAQYTESPRQYTVTFNNYDGTKITSVSVEYGKGATAPADPTREADAQYTYTFSSWDKDFSNITGDLTVTAQYTSHIRSYTVTFVNFNGVEIDKQTVEYGKGATAPADVPSKPADAQYTYTFSNWDKDFSNITGDLTVTAQFTGTLNKYSVVFLDYDGTELDSQMIEYGKGATAPENPTREADENYVYKFSKWDTDFSNITGDTTVKAEYTAIELITIYFTNDKKWDNVYCCAWYDSEGSAVLPGTEMTYVSTNSFGSDIYSVKVPADIDNVMFNGGSNSNKTVTVTDGIANGIGFYPTKQNSSKNWVVETYVYGGEDVPPYVQFEFEIDIEAPEYVEVGSSATINVSTNSTSAVTYDLYASTGIKTDTNTTGVFDIETTEDQIGESYTYYVVATTIVDGDTYTITSERVTFTVRSAGLAWTVSVYFKSSSSLGYRPVITTEGALSDLTDYDMIKTTCLGTNSTQTGFYYWYKAEFDVVKDSPDVAIKILSRRYAMEGNTTITFSDKKTEVYLGIDNLNSGVDFVDLTNRPQTERDWFSSAVHMVYDKKLDGAIDMSSVASNFCFRAVGDSNGDGKVNIKDATLVQKHLAALVELDAVSLSVSDVNDDYDVTIKDATTIQKKVAGLL
ncbi:MAG: starch-binding protein [Clostridia bacterium]|nr:starch-binding protein [Clostridia bacterium]